MIRTGLIATVLGVLLVAPALAQPGPPPAPASPGTTLTLSERAEKTLPRDRLHAELRVEAIGANPVRVQAAVNGRMTAALARAKAATGVTVETAGYSVYQERDAKANVTRWRGSQSLRLGSGDFATLLSLVGALQEEGLALSNLAAELSPAAAKTAQDELTDTALKELRARAARIAATLGTHVERYTELHVGNVSVPPVPIRFMAAAAPAGMPAPVAATGDATVAVTVDATVRLAPVR
ncbi:MAG: SIMPL domain-containing protein [Alphaproteobacteria bacterium]|nr:SIMPL domain-containing protein [Alphaproteobacteria bacterium]